MSRPTAAHPERTTIWTAAGGTLIALGGVLVALVVPRNHWTESDGSLALFALGLLCLLLGLYVFLHFWVPWLHLPEPRRRIERRAPSLSSIHLPLWLNPLTPRKNAANILLEEGYNLLNSIPTKPTDPLAAALVGVQIRREEKLLAQWEGRVTTFLHARAQEHTALFRSSLGLPASGPAMKTYLTDRLEELKAIHAQL